MGSAYSQPLPIVSVTLEILRDRKAVYRHRALVVGVHHFHVIQVSWSGRATDVLQLRFQRLDEGKLQTEIPLQYVVDDSTKSSYAYTCSK